MAESSQPSHSRKMARRARRDTSWPKTAEALRKERDLLWAVLNSTDALMFVLDRQGRIIGFNRGCHRTTGYDTEEASGKVIWELLAPGQREEIQAACRELHSDQPPRRHEGFWRTKDGRDRLIAWTSTAVVAESGAVEFVLGTGWDVTEQRQAEEARRLHDHRLNSLLNLTQRAPEMDERAFIQLTLEEVVRLTGSQIGYLHFVNPDQETIQLYTWSEATQRSCSLVHDEHYPLSQAGVWADCARLRQPVIHNDYQRLAEKRGYPEGHSHIVRHASIPLMDGDRVTIILGVGNKPADYDEGDVRQMRLACENLWKTIQRKRADALLRQHVEALEEESRRKNDFLATLAHELRNPLAPIGTALEILQRPEIGAEVARKSREVISRQLGHMVRLVDDLLDLSRITRGKIELRRHRVALAEVVANAIEVSSTIIADRRHQLLVSLPEQPVELWGDRVRLTQVIANLLTNSAKYTPPGGRIELSGEARDGELAIRVRDTGIGIAADVLPKVFDMFVQADRSLDRSDGGLGIGLTLVRRLVELHGGTVSAFSPGPGQGSEFTVRLPLAAAEFPEPEDRGGRPATTVAAGCRVLVVDDNVDAAEMLAALLIDVGHSARVAHDGQSALEAIQAFQPEAVLLDIGLPNMDGYEVARRLRADPVARGALLLAVTGYGNAQDVARSREAGFDQHLVKPIDLNRLLDLLAAVHAQ